METITLTDAAAAKAAALRDDQADGLALRVAVRPGGCSGYSYEMYFDSDIAADDVSAEYVVDGTKPLLVVSDVQSAQLLTGASLDYRDGLTDAGFKISNPKASRTCGCGQSFS